MRELSVQTGLEPALSPQGCLYLSETTGDAQEQQPLPESLAERLRHAFEQGEGPGLLYLGGNLVEETLPSAFGFWRDFGRNFFSKLCARPDVQKQGASLHLELPAEEFERMAGLVPPMRGAEYLTPEVLKKLWSSLEAAFAHEFSHFQGGLQEYLRTKNEVWNVVGRVCLHLAENKQNTSKPFAFLATYAAHLSQESKVQHHPLGKALEEYAGDREALLNLLLPIQKAAEKSPFLKKWVDEGKIYHPLALDPGEALAFLKNIPLFEESGVVVRVPNWWAAKRPPRPQVNVTIGEKESSFLGAAGLLDFSMEVSLDGQKLTRKELDEILKTSAGLIYLKGKWVELNPEKLQEALNHWDKIGDLAAQGLISYPEAMRLLAGLPFGGKEEAAASSESVQEWTHVRAGEWLGRLLRELRQPEKSQGLDMESWLQAQLRPYQKKGVQWLWLLKNLGLGGCLADDMGLGKTIQVLGLLSGLKKKGMKQGGGPHLIVVPASLLSNWKTEINRFAPHLNALVAHPSEMSSRDLTHLNEKEIALKEIDIVLLSYAGLARLNWPKEIQWNVVALDEAQAIKNPNALQTRAAKALKGATRLVLTGTPVENRLSDLWSLFDFICPGLLGSAKTFAAYAKKLAGASGAQAYGPIRSLVAPYILRRLKTDKRVIADLPEKTELKAYCSLTKRQAALYGQSVAGLEKDLKKMDGGGQQAIKRRGIILAYLTRLKQICNHPSQWLGDQHYQADQSGKFARLAEICEPINSRQEKCLVFTQFREMTGPLDSFLAGVFKRKGLVLHGQTPVVKRKELVNAFQDEQGPPYFILSLRAGGTGLNLTAASHVIHFDRWWNPAVENQATDRTFRIGQKKNVLVHKFICRGTVEEKIDNLIDSKKNLAENLLDSDSGALLTEMGNEELIKTITLDIHRALGEEQEN